MSTKIMHQLTVQPSKVLGTGDGDASQLPIVPYDTKISKP